MKRLSLEDLKAQASQKVTNNLEAIKGGNAGDCHCSCMDQAIKQNPDNANNEYIGLFCWFADVVNYIMK